jgi:hypothetical protein
MTKTRATSLLLAGTLGLGGLAGGLVLAPAVATAATSSTTASDAVAARVSRITEALSGLVSDGTLTQPQADRVATTLAEQLPPRGHGPGGRGHHGGPGRGLGPVLQTAAEAIGVPVDELRAALADGRSLAQVAEAEGVERQTVVDALVAAANAHIDEHVADGDLTAEQAEARKAEVAERVADLVDREGLPAKARRGGESPAEGTDGEG